jgi:hypothetical protein
MRHPRQTRGRFPALPVPDRRKRSSEGVALPARLTFPQHRASSRSCRCSPWPCTPPRVVRDGDEESYSRLEPSSSSSTASVASRAGKAARSFGRSAARLDSMIRRSGSTRRGIPSTRRALRSGTGAQRSPRSRLIISQGRRVILYERRHVDVLAGYVAHRRIARLARSATAMSLLDSQTPPERSSAPRRKPE